MTDRDPQSDTDATSSHFENVLGTSLEIQWTAWPGHGDVASRVERTVLDEIARLERILSTHRADTELSHWLETWGEPMPISADLGRVLQASERWVALTRGAFHPAFAARNRPPTTSSEEPAWSVHEADGRWTARRLSDAELGFDAIAKGYIVDRAAEAAAAVPGVRDAVINLGGDIRHCGTRKVVLGVSDPVLDAENAEPLARLEISNHGVATSGGRRRGELRDGVWHSHLVDPRTGRAADHLCSATVVASCTADADALATAFAVLDPEESLAIADSIPSVSCLVVDAEGTRLGSTRWAEVEIPAPSHPPGTSMTRREMLTRFLPAGLAIRSFAGAVGDADAAGDPGPSGARITWDETFELLVEFDFGDLRGGMPGRRPYVVVYIDTADGAPVRTLSLWSQQASWVRELTRWQRGERARKSEEGGDLVMSLASPTRGAGHYSVVWDGRDNQGNLVEQGEYFVCLESVRQGSSSYFTREPFTFETTPFQAQMQDYAGFRDIQLDYRQRS